MLYGESIPFEWAIKPFTRDINTKTGTLLGLNGETELKDAISRVFPVYEVRRILDSQTLMTQDAALLLVDCWRQEAGMSARLEITLAHIMEQLFCDHVTDQRLYILGWLKVAVESLRAGTGRPGQGLAMAGPRNCGKSLFQNLITEILGGRAAKPYRYMSGQTPFNADLFAAEHLMIEDECGSTDLRPRREFGARIKDFTVNEVQSCHAKNRQALSLRPFWRLSISLNDEPENLMILPPMDESLNDKLTLLKVHRAQMPMPTDTNEARAAFWDALMAELPAFIGYLLHWKIPEPLRCPRFGVTTFHHPDILCAIDGISPESRLLSLIDAVVFADKSMTDGPLVMTAEELESKLTSSSMGLQARLLLNWNPACGTYLGRLATKDRNRVERNKKPILYGPPIFQSPARCGEREQQ